MHTLYDKRITIYSLKRFTLRATVLVIDCSVGEFWNNYLTNKTSIQWTPGSQIDRSNQKIIFSKKWFLKKTIKKPINYAWFMHFLIFFVQKSFLTKNYFLTAEIKLTTRGPLYTCLVFIVMNCASNFFAIVNLEYYLHSVCLKSSTVI